MLIAVLLAAGLAWWLHQRGELLPNLQVALLGGGALLLTIRMLETGKPLAAALVAGAAYLGWRYMRRKPPTVPIADVAAARALLGVAADADAADIRAAWLRLMADVHPDRGGSADLAARVTAARDLLIARHLQG